MLGSQPINLPQQVLDGALKLEHILVMTIDISMIPGGLLQVPLHDVMHMFQRSLLVLNIVLELPLEIIKSALLKAPFLKKEIKLKLSNLQRGNSKLKIPV